LQTCSFYMCIHDLVCICVYIYLLDLSSTYEGKHLTFVSKGSLRLKYLTRWSISIWILLDFPSTFCIRCVWYFHAVFWEFRVHTNSFPRQEIYLP
jgi:hypothetical protein